MVNLVMFQTVLRRLFKRTTIQIIYQNKKSQDNPPFKKEDNEEHIYRVEPKS